MEPEEFGKYTLVELLGTGGMARVYRAVLRGAMGFEKEVALKRIKSHVKLDDRYLQALINEARLGGQLRHRNIVEVYEFDEVGGEYYLAMEYVEGWTLLDLISGSRAAQQPIPPAIVLLICIDICRGLDHAHSMSSRSGLSINLVHRDLKPANVIVSARGEVKIMDFGIAKADSNLFKTTAAQITKGTPLYMSPEQVDASSKLTRQSDVFSLGSILYELLFMQPLFAGDHALEVLHRVIMADIDQALELARVRLPGLETVLQRALARKPEDRYRTAGEMAEDLDALLERIGPAPTLMAWLAGYEREQTSLHGEAGGTVGPDDPTELFSEPAIGEDDATQRFSPGAMPVEEATTRQFSSQPLPPDDLTRQFFETTAGYGVPPSPPPGAYPPSTPEPEQSRRGRWLVPAVALLMILGVGVALFGTVGAAMLGFYARDQRPGITVPDDPPTAAPIAADDDDSAAGGDGLAGDEQRVGEDEVTATVPVEPSTPSPPPEPPTRAPPPEPPTPEPPTPSVLPPPPVYDSDEPSVITVNAVPWAEVYLDGRVFERTPIIDRQIPPGRHELRVVCGTCGSHQEATVVFDVAPGEAWKKTDFRFLR